jgi:hypothetical protein
MQENALGLHSDGSFRFNIPATLVKSKDGKVWIEGIASVEKPDLQGETVILKGMDLSYFVKRGYLNDNHSKDTSAKVGVPTEAKVISEDGTHKLFVKGFMLDTPRAKSIIELAESLEKAGTDRKLGFSVEGKVRERDGKIIKKSWVKDIALTSEPVSVGTYMNICKSLSDRIAQDGYVEEEEPSFDQDEFLDRVVNTITETITKSLEAGFQRPPESGGSALRNESLEGDIKNQDIPQEEAEEADEENIGNPDAQGKKKGKKLTKAQTVELIIGRGHSLKTAERMAEVIFNDAVRRSLVGE